MSTELMSPTLSPSRAFLDWPIVTDPEDWRADIAVIGSPQSEPYAKDRHPNDQASAPAAIRNQSHQFSDGPEQWDFDIDSSLSAVQRGRRIDCGDVPWLDGDYDRHAARVTALVSRLFQNHAQVFLLGGDHGVTIPVLDALETLGEPVHIVHIDAHLDWRSEVQGVRRGYSSPMFWASQRPWISGMTQIGMRGTGSARRGEVMAARAYGARIIPAETVHSEGFAPILAAIPAHVPTYVTLDADGMDPTEMPGVLAPAPGGLLFRQVAPFLRRLARRQRVVGFEIVEVAPSFDASNAITAITAGRLIVNVIGASKSLKDY